MGWGISPTSYWEESGGGIEGIVFVGCRQRLVCLPSCVVCFVQLFAADFGQAPTVPARTRHASTSDLSLCENSRPSILFSCKR